MTTMANVVRGAKCFYSRKFSWKTLELFCVCFVPQSIYLSYWNFPKGNVLCEAKHLEVATNFCSQVDQLTTYFMEDYLMLQYGRHQDCPICFVLGHFLCETPKTFAFMSCLIGEC